VELKSQLNAYLLEKEEMKSELNRVTQLYLSLKLSMEENNSKQNIIMSELRNDLKNKKPWLTLNEVVDININKRDKSNHEISLPYIDNVNEKAFEIPATDINVEDSASVFNHIEGSTSSFPITTSTTGSRAMEAVFNAKKKLLIYAKQPKAKFGTKNTINFVEETFKTIEQITLDLNKGIKSAQKENTFLAKELNNAKSIKDYNLAIYKNNGMSTKKPSYASITKMNTSHNGSNNNVNVAKSMGKRTNIPLLVPKKMTLKHNNTILIKGSSNVNLETIIHEKLDGVSLKSMRQTRNNDIIIETFNEKDNDYIRQEIAKKIPEASVKEIFQRLPRISIFGIPKLANEDDILRNLSGSRIIRIKELDRNKIATLEVSPDTFKSVMERKIVTIKLIGCRVEESLYISCCSKCLKPGHLGKDCKSNQACYKCAGSHKGSICFTKKFKCIICSEMNKLRHKVHDINHMCNGKFCPALIGKQVYLKSITLYVDDNKKIANMDQNLLATTSNAQVDDLDVVAMEEGNNPDEGENLLNND
jgi:hypothetical protein